MTEQRECYNCKARMEWSTTPFDVQRKGYRVHLDAVPAWVCTACRAVCFEGREVDAVQAVAKLLDKSAAEIASRTVDAA